MILLIDNSNKAAYPELMESMFRLRKRMFIDKLKWSIRDTDGLEIDQFDNEHTIYFVETPDGRTCRGAWRAYPTMQPYMVETVFSHFMGDHEIVKSPHAYELSRSVVDWAAFDWDPKRARTVHIRLFCATVEWSIINDIFELVSFSDPRVTRKTSYLYGTPVWKGKVMNCGDGLAQCVIYRPGLDQLRKFREEADVEVPAITQFTSGAWEARHAS